MVLSSGSMGMATAVGVNSVVDERTALTLGVMVCVGISVYISGVCLSLIHI